MTGRRQAITLMFAAAALFAGVLDGHAQAMPRIIINDYGLSFDTTTVWHPERIRIIYPDMDLEFRLPDEQEQSGVFNLFFRERNSGEIRLLDSMKDNPSYGESWMVGFADNTNNKPIYRADSVKYFRYANLFVPGSYDAILLYNNGRYIVYENITFEDGVKMIVDLAGQPVREADDDSLGWLKLRKFTDPFGERLVEKEALATSQYWIAGYLFNMLHDGKADSFAAFYRWPPDKSTVDWDPQGQLASGVSRDGYFEIDVEEKDVTYTFNMAYSAAYIARAYADLNLKAGTWLFIVTEKHTESIEKWTQRTEEERASGGKGL